MEAGTPSLQSPEQAKNVQAIVSPISCGYMEYMSFWLLQQRPQALLSTMASRVLSRNIGNSSLGWKKSTETSYTSNRLLKITNGMESAPFITSPSW